jgi:hypothetical protein
MVGNRGIVDELAMQSPRRESNLSRSFLATLLFCRRSIQSAAYDAIHMIEKRGHFAGLPSQDAAIARSWIECQKPKIGTDYYGTFDWCCEWLGESGIAKLGHDMLHMNVYDLNSSRLCFRSFEKCAACHAQKFRTAPGLRFALCEKIEQAWMDAKIEAGIVVQLRLFSPSAEMRVM